MLIFNTFSNCILVSRKFQKNNRFKWIDISSKLRKILTQQSLTFFFTK